MLDKGSFMQHQGGSDLNGVAVWASTENQYGI